MGRPLPYGAEGVKPVSEEALPRGETLGTARELVKAGRPFSAHEVLEARWKAGPIEERDLWQGLAQLCVGMTHAARGNQEGADRLFDRAADRLSAFAATGRWAYGLDLDATATQAGATSAGSGRTPGWRRCDAPSLSAPRDPRRNYGTETSACGDETREAG